MPEDTTVPAGEARERWRRESLARELGRAPGHNYACAVMLRTRTGPGVPERLATHLEAAGYLQETLDPLMQAARERVMEGAYGLADGLLERAERIMAKAGIDEDDAWRGAHAVARGAHIFGVG